MLRGWVSRLIGEIAGACAGHDSDWMVSVVEVPAMGSSAVDVIPAGLSFCAYRWSGWSSVVGSRVATRLPCWSLVLRFSSAV